MKYQFFYNVMASDIKDFINAWCTEGYHVGGMGVFSDDKFWILFAK